MDKYDLQELLHAVAQGAVAPDEAVAKLQVAPFEDLGFAKVDHHRGIRQGTAEVIYGAGKTPHQIVAIVQSLLAAGQKRVLITRIAPSAARQVQDFLEQASDDVAAAVAVATDAATADAADAADVAAANAVAADTARDEVAADTATADATDTADRPLFTYYDLPQLALVGDIPQPTSKGSVVVACGGTSDVPVAEEAALTAEMLGSAVERLYDVGVAGLHRLLSHAATLQQARVVVAVAGMEGALPSVVAGMVSCPVIAVPTSVGYGASFDGLAALLGMLNSCASGVSVVNIDNGFGAGYLANMIGHL